MAKINFIKGQRPTPTKSFDGVYNNGGELSIGTEIVGSKKLYFVYNTESGKKSSYYDSEMEAKNQLNKMKNNLVGGMTYGDGGEVAEKIKGRLAKGSFELPMEMIVYVPSTKDGNIIIPKADFQARVKSVRAYLATKFGGFSSNPTDGGYMSNDNKGLIEEDVVKVTAFATKESLEENLDALLKKIQSWCKAWSQESIGFEFEGDLFYISATSKFMNGGEFGGGGGVGSFPFMKFEDGQEAIRKVNNGELPKHFSYVEKEKTLYFLPNVMAEWVQLKSFETKQKAIEWVKSNLESEGFANGGEFGGGGGVGSFPFMKFEDGQEAIRKVNNGELPKHFSYVEKEKTLYFLPNVMAEWVQLKSFETKQKAIEWVKSNLESEGFANGGEFGGGGEAEDQDNRTMIMRQAKEVSHHVEELNEILSKQPDIDAWVVAKMQDVTTQLSEITHYLDSRVGFRLGGDDIQAVQDSMLKDGGEIILGGGSMVSVQDSILANGARLDNAQASIKDIERQLEKYQRLAADYMHSTRNPTYSPYDKDVDRLEKKLQQKLKESDIYNFDTEDDFSERTLGKKSISKEIQMAQSWLPRIASPYRPRSYSYSKFVRSLITPMQKDVFEKLQKEYWQKAWNIKIKISPKKDTIEFEHYNKKKGNWYMEDGGEIAANGAKLKSGKLTLSKLKSMIEEYNAEGRNFELLGAYNQLELWGNDHRLETGSKEDIYRALIRYRYNPKYADGTELSNIDSMTDEEIITFANTFSYYDRMDEGIEEEFTDVEDAKEYLRMMAESE
jgi:hypothetical protein